MRRQPFLEPFARVYVVKQVLVQLNGLSVYPNDVPVGRWKAFDLPEASMNCVVEFELVENAAEMNQCALRLVVGRSKALMLSLFNCLPLPTCLQEGSPSS